MTSKRAGDFKMDATIFLFGRDELLMEAGSEGQGSRGQHLKLCGAALPTVLENLAEGKTTEARALQDKAIEMIRICASEGVSHQAATKGMMGWHGVDCGPMRLPVTSISAKQLVELRAKLEAIGYFDVACVPV